MPTLNTIYIFASSKLRFSCEPANSSLGITGTPTRWFPPMILQAFTTFSTILPSQLLKIFDCSFAGLAIRKKDSDPIFTHTGG